MNLIADRMEPYLRSSGITYVRNDPDRMLPEPLQIPTPAISTYTLPFTATPHRNPWQACCGALMCTIPPTTNTAKLAVIIANNFMSIYPCRTNAPQNPRPRWEK